MLRELQFRSSSGAFESEAGTSGAGMKVGGSRAGTPSQAGHGVRSLQGDRGVLQRRANLDAQKQRTGLA